MRFKDFMKKCHRVLPRTFILVYFFFNPFIWFSDLSRSLLKIPIKFQHILPKVSNLRVISLATQLRSAFCSVLNPFSI